MAHLRPPFAIPGWNPAGGGGCGLFPLHQQVWATAGWNFGVHYPRGAQDGDGEGLVPSSGPKQCGCAARVSPSSYVTACSCHGHGGAGGGPGSGNGGLEAPSQGSILTSTTGGCVSHSLESRVLTSGDIAASFQSVWASACWSVKQTHCTHDLRELGHTMLTGVTDGIFCCLLGAPPNAVGPLESVESSDGYTFVEVKPGRVLRVKHAGPAPAPTPPPPLSDAAQGDQSGLVRCQRRITVYRNGRLLVENLGRAPRADLLHGQNGSGEPPAALEVELADPAGSDGRSVPGSAGSGSGGRRRRARRPKRTIHIDCEKRITSCKGAQADVVLFFIHGVGGSLAIWKEQLDFFVRLGYEVVAPDLAGHGASSAPQVAAAYTFYALAEDMRAIFKRYAKKRNVLIGHSYGVSFCTFLAHEYPDLVHKVIMINGGGPTALEPSLCSVFNMPTCVLHCLSPCLAWSFLKAGFARQGAKEKQLLKEGNAFNVSSFVLRAMMSGQYWPEGDEVYHAELTVPVLLVHGMHDKFVPVEEDQRMAEILLLAFLKLIDEGSHMVMLECPETVNTLLHEFLLWEPEPSPKALPEPLPAPPEEKK